MPSVINKCSIPSTLLNSILVFKSIYPKINYKNIKKSGDSVQLYGNVVSQLAITYRLSQRMYTLSMMVCRLCWFCKNDTLFTTASELWGLDGVHSLIFYNANLPSKIWNQFIEPKTENARQKEGCSTVDTRTERLQDRGCV